MPEFVRVKDPSTQHEFSVGADDDLSGLEVLDKPAIDVNGNPLPAKPYITLRGADLDEALTSAGLPTTGKAEDKRERLSGQQVAGAAGTANTEEK